jgi:hypothetical protein
VTVHRSDVNGGLRLGVFRRGTNGSVSLQQTWNLARTFSHVEIMAADLDGSKDGKQELAILLQANGTGGNALEVYVLTGNAQGLIAEDTSGAWAGRWVLPGAFPLSSLAVGDLLLSGREQMLVVNESGSGGTTTCWSSGRAPARSRSARATSRSAAAASSPRSAPASTSTMALVFRAYRSTSCGGSRHWRATWSTARRPS